MIVLDTNLLVRLATNDVPKDREVVATLMEKHRVHVSKTVLLETEWVLRSRYAYSLKQFGDFLDYLLALPSVVVEDESIVRWAVAAGRAGIDFADALHLSVAAALGEPFYTFDKALHRKAGKLKDTRIQLLKS